jgi:hypothetical protein
MSLSEIAGQGSAAETDDGQVTEHPGHLSGHPQRRVDADHVHHEFSALLPRKARC